MTAVNRARMAGLSALLLLAAGCKGGDAGLSFDIEISQHFAGEPLQLNHAYTLADGDALSVDKLRYYLSNVRLHRPDGGWSNAVRSDDDSRGYYLVDAADAASRHLKIDGIAAGVYDGLELLIGVDAARNTQGAQTGALDPARGMFWTWNTGYVFFKLEGHSPQSTAAAQSVTYHIGGSQPPLARTVYLPLGDKPLKLDRQVSGIVHLVFDLATVFEASPALRLAEHNSIMEPAQGPVVADRYGAAFRVDHVHQEPRH